MNKFHQIKFINILIQRKTEDDKYQNCHQMYTLWLTSNVYHFNNN